MRRNQTTLIALFMTATLARSAVGQDHVVIGQSPPGGPPFQLFTAPGLQSGSGHGPAVFPGQVLPILRINLNSFYGRPGLGGNSFSTSGFSGLGFDFAAPPNNLDGSLIGVSGFWVATRRLAYDRPTEFSIYHNTGAPQMVEDGQEYVFGNQSNGGHVHPLVLLRRPGQVRWTMRFTSDAWPHSDDYEYVFTSVPGRGALTPIDLTSIFNADVIDSDASDNPAPFDAAGNRWLLNGLYGATAGLPVDGRLAGFQLGGPDAAGLLASNLNALFDDGALSLAATLDLAATGQAERFLSVELLLGGAGSFAAAAFPGNSADRVTVTFIYDDDTTRTYEIQKVTAGTVNWLAYRPIDDWQQIAAPRPWTAVGARGDRSLGFLRSDGTGVDAAAGQNTFLFRACMPLDSSKTLDRVTFADYAGSGRVAIFAMLGIRKANLEITTSELPDAVEGVSYSLALTAEGTPPFHNWSATGLPDGLSIDVATGLVSGTPAAGSAGGSPYAVTLGVDDSIHLFDASYPPESHVTVRLLNVLPPQPQPGDIDGDGCVNELDRNLFVSVLLGVETDPTYVGRCDLDGSGGADGDDVALFLSLLFASGC